jgi:hypothetical protein
MDIGLFMVLSVGLRPTGSVDPGGNARESVAEEYCLAVGAVGQIETFRPGTERLGCAGDGATSANPGWPRATSRGTGPNTEVALSSPMIEQISAEVVERLTMRCASWWSDVASPEGVDLVTIATAVRSTPLVGSADRRIGTRPSEGEIAARSGSGSPWILSRIRSAALR